MTEWGCMTVSEMPVENAKGEITRTIIKAGEINEPAGFSEEIAKMFVDLGLSEVPPSSESEALSIMVKLGSSILNTIIEMADREKTLLTLISAWTRGAEK